MAKRERERGRQRKVNFLSAIHFSSRKPLTYIERKG